MTKIEYEKKVKEANRIQREGGAALRDHMMVTGTPYQKLKKKKTAMK